MPTTRERRTLTRKEVAAMLGVGIREVTRLHWAGRLKRLRFGQRKTLHRYTMDSVERLLDSGN